MQQSTGNTLTSYDLRSTYTHSITDTAKIKITVTLGSIFGRKLRYTSAPVPET